MRSLLGLLLTGVAQAEIYMPTQEWDLKAWRILPIQPYVFLQDSLYYVIFKANDGNYVMTVKGKFDNNLGLSVQADAIDDVARGFFLRDASYGFRSLDGFVVYYNAVP